MSRVGPARLGASGPSDGLLLLFLLKLADSKEGI